ncbi:hypothetical protein [uncultured Flavonifractor sp.]|uniref:hypothetical protein n=1 Tax=uncultured Flavonifractor sp. TaxID=1193534 RepID=UPI00266F07A1|nr:hypothetical protein [uncultured Flavonifractor sp.]
MTRRSYFWLLCAVSLLLTLRSVYQIGKTLLAGGMTGLLPNAILLVCLIAVDGYLLWSALRAAPAVEAPPSPGQKAPLCRVGWTCLRILAAAGLLVLFLKDLLPLWAVFLLLGVMILLMVLIAWRFCRCPRCGGRLRERDVGAEGICPHCGARL